MLRGSGYATLGVSANPLVSRVTGLDRGFERFVDAWRQEPGGEHPDLAAVRALLGELPAERPYFLFVNFMEAHEPYRPRADFRERFVGRPPDDPVVRSALARSVADFHLGRVRAEELAVLRDHYDAEIATVDALVAELLDLLDAAGRLDEALVVVTSDHGESFGERGHFRHVFHLYESVTHVPLLIVPPGGGPGRVREDATSGVDVFATLAAAAGVALPPGRYPGRDLLASRDAGPVFAEYYTPLQALANLPAGVLAAHPEVFEPFRRRLRTVEAEGHLLVWSDAGAVELYALGGGIGEGPDLAGRPDQTGRVRRLRGLLDAFVAAGGGEPPRPAHGGRAGLGELDPATTRRLEALGYLEGGAGGPGHAGEGGARRRGDAGEGGARRRGDAGEERGAPR
jgi:hypothetical protein